MLSLDCLKKEMKHFLTLGCCVAKPILNQLKAMNTDDDVGSVDHSCIFEGTLAWCSTSYLVAPGSPIQKLGMLTTERPTNKISLFSDQVAARDSTALADLACHSIRLQNFAWDLKKDYIN